MKRRPEQMQARNAHKSGEQRKSQSLLFRVHFVFAFACGNTFFIARSNALPLSSASSSLAVSMKRSRCAFSFFGGGLLAGMTISSFCRASRRKADRLGVHRANRSSATPNLIEVLLDREAAWRRPHSPPRNRTQIGSGLPLSQPLLRQGLQGNFAHA